MEVDLQPGKYVVAVSGGVDSVALSHLLAGQPGLQLTVAHFDHGIREDSAEDRRFVQELAEHHGLPYIYDEGHLGAGASEAAARTARYEFLRKVQAASGSQAIVTAHHQDDLLETAILNLLRGTGRKGLTSLAETDDLKRPLLGVPKSQLIDYANQQKLSWREDTTNQDERYRRNYVRHRLVAKLTPPARARLLEIIATQQDLNRQIDAAIADQITDDYLDRRWFVNLPHDVSREVLASWLRRQGLADFDSKTLERLTVGAKVSLPGKQLDVLNGRSMQIEKDRLALKVSER